MQRCNSETSSRPKLQRRQSLEGVDPRAALIRGAEPVAAGPDVLAVVVIAVAVGSDAETETAHARDGLRRADEDVLLTGRIDAAGQGLVAGSVEGALVLGVVVRRVDNADSDVVVFWWWGMSATFP